MKYIDAEELKAQIEKRKNILDVESPFGVGGRIELELVLSAITSLQKEQPIQVNTLTWRDINNLERIINNVHYEFRNGIGEKSFGEEVLERFREERDEQEQPKVDIGKELEEAVRRYKPNGDFGWGTLYNIACYFYELGQCNTKKEG